MKRLILLLLLSSFSYATSHQVNSEHSNIKFKIKYMGITDVEGRFNDYRIFFDLKNNFLSNIKGRIKASSINTNDKKRDAHLKKKDFFSITKYPFIEFETKEVFKIQKNKSINISALIKIKNISKNIPITLIYHGKKEDPWTKKKGLYFKGSFKLNRYDFGLRWNKALDEGGLLIGKEVSINFDFEAYSTNEKPAFSRFFKPQKKINSKPDILPPSRLEVSPKQIEKEKPVVNTKKNIEKSKYFSGKNILITTITGFTIFVLMILLGIFGQKYLIEFLEKKGVSDRATFLLSSTIIMIVLIVISIYVAPFMGLGVNPLVK